jgi:hypothetical protein
MKAKHPPPPSINSSSHLAYNPTTATCHCCYCATVIQCYTTTAGSRNHHPRVVRKCFRLGIHIPQSKAMRPALIVWQQGTVVSRLKDKRRTTAPIAISSFSFYCTGEVVVLYSTLCCARSF